MTYWVTIVFTDCIDVYLTGTIEDNYVIPDISIVCDPNKLTDKGYFGVPTLIVEVISPSTKKVDEGVKYKSYERYKVPEYWQVNYKDFSIKQSILGDQHYEDQIYSLLDDNEFDRLSDEDKKSYSCKFKCSVYDIEVDLNDVFYSL